MDIETIRSKLGSLKTYFTEQPEKAVEADSFAEARLTGGLATTVTGPSGQSVESDMPQGIGGGASAPTPGWYLRAGIASCTVTAIALRAADLGVALDHLSVRVDSRSDNRGFIGLDAEAPAGPLEATMTVAIAGAAGEAELREIAAWGIAHSPMGDALTRAIPMQVVVETGGDAR